MKLNKEQITYYNKLARLLSPNQIELKDSEGKTEVVTAKYILLATGGRPSEPGIPGG